MGLSEDVILASDLLSVSDSDSDVELVDARMLATIAGIAPTERWIKECSHWREKGVFPFDIDIDADAMDTGIALAKVIARKDDEQFARTCSAVGPN